MNQWHLYTFSSKPIRVWICFHYLFDLKCILCNALGVYFLCIRSTRLPILVLCGPMREAELFLPLYAAVLIWLQYRPCVSMTVPFYTCWTTFFLWWPDFYHSKCSWIYMFSKSLIDVFKTQVVEYRFELVEGRQCIFLFEYVFEGNAV